MFISVFLFCGYAVAMEVVCDVDQEVRQRPHLILPTFMVWVKYPSGTSWPHSWDSASNSAFSSLAGKIANSFVEAFLPHLQRC